MTLFEWGRALWRTATPVPERRPVVLMETAMPPVAAPYVAHTYLQHRYASNVVLTFEPVGPDRRV